MTMGARLREIAERASNLDEAINDVIMCHGWVQEDPHRPIEELRAQLAEAIERLKGVRG